MILHTDFNPIYITLALAPVGIVPALIGLGGTLASLLFNRESAEARTAKATQARLAKERGARERKFFQQTQPIIGTLIPQLTALLGGDRTALTQRFAPQLEQLAGARRQAEERITGRGPASGASAQAAIELEKAAFGEQSRLLSAAPAEAQAGLTQLLQLLLGAGQQSGAGATSAAQSVIQGDALSRAADQGFFDSLLEGAKAFGGQLFKPKQPFVPVPGDATLPPAPAPEIIPPGPGTFPSFQQLTPASPPPPRKAFR